MDEKSLLSMQIIEKFEFLLQLENVHNKYEQNELFLRTFNRIFLYATSYTSLVVMKSI